MPTPNYNIPLPNPDNNARSDAQSLADALTQIDGILSGKADNGHGHLIADVSGLQTALDGKSPVGHGHVIADVGGLQTELDNRSLVGHGHLISDITDLQTTLDGKSPVGHGHAISDVTNLQTELDNRSLVGHGHGIADVSGLQTALDGKLNDAAGVIAETHLADGAVTEAKTGPNVWTQGRFASLIGNLPQNTNIAGTESVACDDGNRVTLQEIADLAPSGWDFESGLLPWSFPLTVAHGLGAVPSTIQIWMECVVADLGYSPGDRIKLSFNYDAYYKYIYNVWADATNIGMVYNKGVAQFEKKDMSGYAWISSSSYWAVKIFAKV